MCFHACSSHSAQARIARKIHRPGDLYIYLYVNEPWPCCKIRSVSYFNELQDQWKMRPKWIQLSHQGDEERS